ncbi:MAG: fluoride efflux transporter CrcB, partial [Alloprevotella sp.]
KKKASDGQMTLRGFFFIERSSLLLRNFLIVYFMSLWYMLLLVGIGSGLGGMCRFLLSFFIKTPCGAFPIATLAANLLGCLLIGLLLGLSVRHHWFSKELQCLLVTGFCGGFTTFSTFSTESLMLLRSEAFLSLGLYVGLSLVVGLCMVALGYWLATL